MLKAKQLGSFTQKAIKPSSFQKAIKQRGFFTVVNQGYEAYRELLGQSRTHLKPGIRWNIPFFHTLQKVDMREQTSSVDSLLAYTKDNVPVVVAGSLFYQVFDSEKACYGVNDYKSAVHNIGQSTVRSLVGRFEYDKISSERSALNIELQKSICDATEEWGIRCTKFEIQNFAPENDQIARQLERQMEAERMRRSNELEVQAKIRTAEGDKLSSIYKSEGEKQSLQNISDARRYDTEQQTNAYANQIQTLVEQLGDPTLASSFIIEMSRIKAMNAIAESKGKDKIYFCPSDEFFSKSQILTDSLLQNKK